MSSPPSAPWIIRPDQLGLQHDAHLGGRIARGTWRGVPVAAKVLTKQAEASTLHELAELWTSLRHAHVLQTFGVSPLDADPLYTVTQFQPAGNVLTFLKQNPHVDRAKIVYDVVVGMEYLHARNIVHGSLKPNNILINVDGGACISDYGMIQVQTGGSHGHRYFSPEAWKGTLSRPSDVYAWAMCALEIFTSKPPWGILTEKQIFRLVVQQDTRPDRPDEDFGLTDRIWGTMEECWHRVSRLRPTFDILARLLRTPLTLESREAVPRIEVEQPLAGSFNPAAGRASSDWHAIQRSHSPMSMISIPPAYEATSTLHPESAPPALSQFSASAIVTPGKRRPADIASRPRPHYTYDGSDAASTSASADNSFDDMSPMFNSLSLYSPDTPNTPWTPDHSLAPSPSIRTSSSGASSRSHNSSGSRARLRTIEPIGEEQSYPDGPQSPPFLAPRGYSMALTDPEPPYLRHMQSTGTFPSDSSFVSPNTYTDSVLSQPSSVGTAPNANLLAGALLTEVKEGRKRELIDDYLGKIQKLGLRSQKDAQKLVTAGTIPTLILLLKTRAVDGIGLEAVLLTLGILTHDPITANTIYRTNTTTTLIAIVDAAQSDNIMALAVWCLARIARSTEVASGLLKHNLGKLLVTKGLKGGRDTARISGWCLGTLIRSDSIAEALAEAGFATVLAEHLRRCAASIDARAEDYSAALYAVARFSRSIKIAKVLTRGGTVEVIAHLLLTTEDPRVLEWAARAVGCLMRPNSGDMAKALLDAGIARGLARLPSMLPAEDITPLGAFAFAVQRFSCAEWGGGTRKALVDAGVVDSLLAALRTAADEAYPQVHIELAYAIALLADVGGTAIRKEIVNAGGIDILKHIAGAGTVRADVGKACNLAVTSITGNVWSRNAASAKAALAHEWSGGCPDYVPECPVRLTDLDADSW